MDGSNIFKLANDTFGFNGWSSSINSISIGLSSAAARQRPQAACNFCSAPAGSHSTPLACALQTMLALARTTAPSAS